MEEHKRLGSRVILGIILIAIGVIYLAKSFYFPIDISHETASMHTNMPLPMKRLLK